MKWMVSILFVTCLVLSHLSIVQARERRKERNGVSSLPSNLILSEEARLKLEKVWLRSPTFRDQCRRIAQSPQAEIRFDFVVRNSAAYHAITTVRKTEGNDNYDARLYLRPPGRDDRARIRACAGTDRRNGSEGSGVCFGSRRTPKRRGLYETRRAIEAGRKVFREYRAARREEEDRQRMESL